jgi:hypothetical protein
VLVLVLAAWLALEPPAERAAAEPVPAAGASGQGVTLEWTAPAGCPSRESVEARLDQLLDGRTSSTARVIVHATVEAQGKGFTLQLRTETGSGINEHTLSSPDCQALADGAALVAAVAADPLAVDRGMQEPSEPVPELPPDGVVVRTSPPLEDPPRPRGRLRLARFGLRAEGVLTHGVLPKLGFGPIVTVGLLGPSWRAELAAIYLAPREVFADASKTAGAAIGSWAVRMRGCGVPVWRQLEFPLCGGFEGGQLTARPLRTAPPQGIRNTAFGMFSAGGSIGYSPRPFIAVFAGVDAIVPLVRPRFTIGADLLHRPDPAGVRASIGLELRVP